MTGSGTEQRWRAEIQSAGGSAFVDLPFDVPAVWGTRGRVSIKGTIDGHAFLSSTLPRKGRWYVVVNREMRDRMGVGPGDAVDITVDRDDEPRTIEAPEDLADALAGDPAADAAWATMSYSHRREYVRWIEDAKRPATRARRVTQAVPMVAARQHRD